MPAKKPTTKQIQRHQQIVEVEHVQVSALEPYAANSRTHSAEQVRQVAASIKEFGFTNPVLVDEKSGIIAGHCRVMAAKQLGMESVPCIRLRHLSDTQKRAYVIADNQIALNAGWDEQLLTQELEALAGLDFDITLTGFDSIPAFGVEDLKATSRTPTTREIDASGYVGSCKCPKCGFEFDAK